PANGGTPICSAGVCGVQCDVSGVFALRLQLAVSWPSTTYLAGGNGTFVSWMRLEITQTRTALQTQVTPCGQNVPDFKSTPVINETYGLTYPATAFERAPGQPRVAGSGTLGGRSPGASFAVGPTAWTLGCTLANPVTDAWPS